MKYLALFGLLALAPFVAPASAAAQGDVLYSETFDKPSDFWVRASDSGASRYESGALVLKAFTVGRSLLVLDETVYDDTVIEVEMRFMGGTDVNWQMIICRYVAEGNYYSFGVSADGYYLISAWENAQKRASSVGPIRSPHVVQGVGGVNRVRAECVGDQMRLFANGQLLAAITDDAHRSGVFGVSVNSQQGEFSEVAFDNLVVRRPDR